MLGVSGCEADCSGAAGDIRCGFNRFLYTVYNVQMSRIVLWATVFFLRPGRGFQSPKAVFAFFLL